MHTKCIQVIVGDLALLRHLLSDTSVGVVLVIGITVVEADPAITPLGPELPLNCILM